MAHLCKCAYLIGKQTPCEPGVSLSLSKLKKLKRSSTKQINHLKKQADSELDKKNLTDLHDDLDQILSSIEDEQRYRKYGSIIRDGWTKKHDCALVGYTQKRSELPRRSGRVIKAAMKFSPSQYDRSSQEEADAGPTTKTCLRKKAPGTTSAVSSAPPTRAISPVPSSGQQPSMKTPPSHALLKSVGSRSSSERMEEMLSGRQVMPTPPGSGPVTPSHTPAGVSTVTLPSTPGGGSPVARHAEDTGRERSPVQRVNVREEIDRRNIGQHIGARGRYAAREQIGSGRSHRI